MTLNLTSPVLSRLFHPPSPLTPKLTPRPNNLAFLSLLLSSPSLKPSFVPKTSLSSENSYSITESLILTHQDLLTKVSAAQDATEALQLISDITGKSSGVVSVSDCCAIITSAIERNNAHLALSVFYSMRSSFDQDNINGQWKWSRPDVSVYSVLVRGLASSLKVSDALKTLDYICRVGVSPGEEVPFGKVVRCPTCIIAIAVAQPQNGVQVASCSKCRYQYELVSGDIVSINSEEISKDLPAWEKALRFLQLLKKSVPAAVHSIVVQTPSGTARTHRFATETVDLPAQEGERVTIASAASSNVYRNIGPFKFSPKPRNTYPGEPLSLTNHENGHESKLLRAPVKDENFSLLNPSVLVPLLAVLATGDAATGIIDPSLPRLILVAAIASIGVGTTLNSLVLPQLNQLPQKSVDVVAIRQQLLSQYDMLQSRIKDLKESAEKEIWMLARMCQLENKIFAVGEPSYRARRTKVKRVREGLENSLKGRIELIDSYARISSMIEIEVEMDSDVLAAEAVGTVETIAEQIQQIMEIENLEERWRLQAEANDEAERLLSSQPLPTEKA